jgi:hypothetical protein
LLLVPHCAGGWSRPLPRRLPARGDAKPVATPTKDVAVDLTRSPHIDSTEDGVVAVEVDDGAPPPAKRTRGDKSQGDAMAAADAAGVFTALDADADDYADDGDAIQDERTDTASAASLPLPPTPVTSPAPPEGLVPHCGAWRAGSCRGWAATARGPHCPRHRRWGAGSWAQRSWRSVSAPPTQH